MAAPGQCNNPIRRLAGLGGPAAPTGSNGQVLRNLAAWPALAPADTNGPLSPPSASPRQALGQTTGRRVAPARINGRGNLDTVAFGVPALRSSHSIPRPSRGPRAATWRRGSHRVGPPTAHSEARRGDDESDDRLATLCGGHGDRYSITPDWPRPEYGMSPRLAAWRRQGPPGRLRACCELRDQANARNGQAVPGNRSLSF